MLTSVVVGVYPMVLPARNAAYSLTVANAKAGAYGLKFGFLWWVTGMILATVYSVQCVPLVCRQGRHGDGRLRLRRLGEDSECAGARQPGNRPEERQFPNL